jgi:hypothetical protein
LLSILSGKRYSTRARSVMSKSDERFVPVSPHAEIMGYEVGHVRAPYSKLVEVLGPPTWSHRPGDGYSKISTEWKVKDQKTGRMFRVHDWKETSAYESDLPSVAAFRRRPEADWYIGATSPIPETVEALEKRLKHTKMSRSR